MSQIYTTASQQASSTQGLSVIAAKSYGCRWAFRRAGRGHAPLSWSAWSKEQRWLRGMEGGGTWEEASSGNEATALAGDEGDGEAAAGEFALQLLRPRRHRFARGHNSGCFGEKTAPITLGPRRSGTKLVGKIGK
jgi:hypothetical protein